jgi:hypothetical protein
MSGYAKQLASFTGLDDETVTDQIIPYLSSFPTKQALVNHLQELLGPGSAQQAFINSYSNQRFPSAAGPTAPIATPTHYTSTKASIASDSIPRSGNLKKTKAKFPTKLPPPRKVNVEAFSEIGTAYRKTHDDDLFTKSSLSSRAATPVQEARVAQSPTPTPAYSHPSSNATTAPSLPDTTSRPALSTLESQPDVASMESSTSQAFTLIPTDEMKSLQETISILRGDSPQDAARKAKPCFCKGEYLWVHERRY